MDNQNNIQFEDANKISYNFDKYKKTFKDIILETVSKIGTFAAVELRGGYWENKPHPFPGRSDYQVYIPDTREIYCGAIDYLTDLLFPYFDDEMKRAWKESQDELNKIYKDNTIMKETNREDQSKETSKEYERHFEDITNRISFRNAKVPIKRILFRALCCFLYRKKYLEIGTMED